MLEKDDFIQLRVSYIEIGKLVQKYGYGQYGGILNILIGQVKCIDSDENADEKMQYLIDSYKRLFMSKGSLSDFVIYDEKREVRRELNEKFEEEVNKVWRIMKDYIC